MANFTVYERSDIGDNPISVEKARSLFKKSLSRYYEGDDIALTPTGLIIKGNLKSFWERAITKATAQINIEGSVLSYRVEGKASLGFWPYVWFLLGFVTGFFFFWYFFDLIEYLISRDRPKKYFEEAYKEVLFELGSIPKNELSSKSSPNHYKGSADSSSESMENSREQIYLLRNGQQMGPYSWQQIKVDLTTGNLKPDVLAWLEGAPTWIPMSQLPGFQKLALKPTGLRPQQVKEDASDSSGSSKGGGVCLPISLGLIAIVALTGALIYWLCSGPNGGVLLANEIEPYATKVLNDHSVLEPSEQIVAYYDETVRLDGSEAAILTNHRFIYYKSGAVDSIKLQEIRDVKRTDSALTDTFEIYGQNGKILKVDIAPLNGADTFANALQTERSAANKSP